VPGIEKIKIFKTRPKLIFLLFKCKKREADPEIIKNKRLVP
jgi:hypothetical protein